MLFSSYEFVFVFLPLTVALYAITRRLDLPIARTAVLVAASAVFYAYFRIDYLFLLLGSITANYVIGNYLQRRPNKMLLVAGIIANIALLAYFKYTDFFIAQISAVTGRNISFLNLALPLGISFHTFQQIAYLVDSHQRKLTEQSFLRYILFVMFFPQLIAGPIVHHAEMMPQFDDKRDGRFVENLALGLTIFFIGLFKKTVIADGLDNYTEGFDKAARGYDITLIEAWGATLAYTLQIYFDFSAYSDMAIGLARIFGIKMPVNFLSPYKAINVGDFWRRWHISLSRWLKTYVYIPLGGNRHGELCRNFSLMATMLIGGLWHGAGWKFVLWGGLHGIYLVIYHTWRQLFADHIRIPRPVAIVITFLAVVIAWVPFRAADLASTMTVYRGIFGLNGIALPGDYAPLLTHIQPLLDLLGVRYVAGAILFDGTRQLANLLFALAFVWLLPNVIDIFYSARPALLPDTYKPVPVAWPWKRNVRWAVSAGLVACLAVAGIGRVIDFIYFQF